VRRATYFLMQVLLGAGLSSCGSNFLAGTEDTDAALSATRALEQKRPSAAIKTLEKALEKDPENTTYLSILSTAYAQRAGIEPLSVAEAIASQSSSSALTSSLTATNDSLISLFGVMPAATEDNLSDIDRAVSILASDLPRSAWLSGDSFKYAIYQTSSTVMHLKALDTNQDGQLSIAEIMGLASGESLINQLSAASTILAGDGSSAASTKAAAAIEAHRAEIAAMDGETMDEKLKNYLAKSSGVSTSSQTSP
jgi:hypothetical protein